MLVLFLLIGCAGFFMVKESLRPSSKNEEDTVEITIEDNWYGRRVLSYLEEQGIIRNADIAYYSLGEWTSEEYIMSQKIG